MLGGSHFASESWLKGPWVFNACKVSNFSPEQLDCLLSNKTATPPAVNQLPFSISYLGGFSSLLWHIHPLFGENMNLWMWSIFFSRYFAEAKQLPRLRWAYRLRGEQKTRYFGSSVGSAWRKYWWNLQTCATTLWRDRQEIWKNMGSSGTTLDCWPGCYIFNADAFQEAFYGGYWHLWFQVVGWRSSHTWEGGISPPDFRPKFVAEKVGDFVWRESTLRSHGYSMIFP